MDFRFTPEQEQSVRDRLRSGEKGIDLAREFGVHRTTISKIKKGTYGRRYYSAVHKPSGEVTTFEVDDKEAASDKDILAILAWVRLL